ncbi:restriction endonuclease subunit S [Sulfitobacter sp. 1A16808]|uniref:restriction endonuclease subunit S n=1 Tax=Sulfitobacter sp. 1A16808 TaxID=3368572 RepID=UPI00374535BB
MIPEAGLKTPLHREDWTTMRLKYLLERKRRDLRPDDGVVTAFRDGVVTLRSNRREDGFTFADKEIGYQGVEPDDLVIHAMDGFAGAIGVSDSRGKCSPVYTITVPRSNAQAHTRFWAYYLRNLAVTGFIESLAKGIRERSTDFRWSDAGNLLVNFPDLDTQKAIADFLDRETARIDQLIEKKQRFLTLTARRIDALVDEAISDPTVPRLRFEHAVHRMQRSVVLSEHDELVRLGLFNRGRGMFKKPAADEEGMGDSSFYFVREGDLILSGQFAWEGAVALATEDEEGCVVSHRYPVFRGKDGINTAYILGLLRSGFGDFLLNESSRGSAGRNRPLNTWRLGKEKIPIPSRALQEAVDRALAFERQLKKKTEHSINLLTEARSAMITAAVTGQIDVTTWGKQGQTDRRLDQIEEAMRA